MKLLYLNTLYDPHILGGAERSVQALAEKMVALGHEVTVITSAPNGNCGKEQRSGVSVHYLPQANVYNWPSTPKHALAKAAWHVIDSYNPIMASRVRCVIRSAKPDLVHTNTIGGFSVSAWDAAHRERVPIVHTLRDYYLLCPRSRMFENGRNCEKQCGPCVALSAIRKIRSQAVEAVVGISRYILNKHLAAGCFRNATIASVVHNSYERPMRELSDASSVNPDSLTLGYLGQLHPSKGLEQLLVAVTRFSSTKVRLLVAGKGSAEYEQRLRSRFASPAVSFVGFVRPEVLLARVDALVAPALWHEPFGRTVIEAYSHGVPVIASRRGGLPEIIDPGETGHLFEPDQPDELHRLLASLTREHCVRMRKRCLQRAMDFSSDRIASQYLAIYEQAVSRHSPCRQLSATEKSGRNTNGCEASTGGKTLEEVHA